MTGAEPQPALTSGHSRRSKRDWTTLGASSSIFILGLAITFAAQAVTSRTLGLRQFGEFSAAYVLATILSGVGAVGLDVAALRFASIYFHQDLNSLLAAFYRWSVRAALSAATVVALLVVLYAVFSAPAKRAPLLLAAAAIPLWAGTRVVSGVLRGMDMSAWALVPDRVLRDGALLGASSFFLLFAGVGGFKPATAMWAILAGSALGFVGSLVKVQLELGRGHPVAPASSADARAWTNAAIGLWIVNGLELTFSRIEVLVIAQAGTSVDTGAMSILLTLSSLVLVPTLALNIVMLPRISAICNGGDRSALIRISREFSWLGLGASLVVALPLLIFSQEALRIFSANSASASAIFDLRLMVLARLLIVPFMPAVAILLMSRHQRSMILPYVLCLVLKVLFLFAIVPSQGLTGAVVVSAISLGLLSLATVWIVKNRYGFVVGLPASPA